MKYIYFPEITNLNQIFENFEYSHEPSRANSFYISSELSNSLGLHKYDAARDVVTLYKSEFCSLRAYGFNQDIKNKIEPHMIGYIKTFELCRRIDNTILVLANDCHGIGSRWVCILPADYDLTQHLSDAEKERIATHKSSFQDAIKNAPENSIYKKAV